MGGTMNGMCSVNSSHGPAVSGSRYCDDCSLQHQLNERAKPAPGTLATLIRDAKSKGLIAPVKSGYQSA